MVPAIDDVSALRPAIVATARRIGVGLGSARCEGFACAGPA
jgi:hypothetical protein